MTHELGIMLIGPVTALVGAVLMGIFVMYRINRYGRVFNWPAAPSNHQSPPRPRTEP